MDEQRRQLRQTTKEKETMKIVVDDNLTITVLERGRGGVHGYFKPHRCRECGNVLAHHSGRKQPLCQHCNAKWQGIVTNAVRSTLNNATGYSTYNYLQKTGKTAQWLLL